MAVAAAVVISAVAPAAVCSLTIMAMNCGASYAVAHVAAVTVVAATSVAATAYAADDAYAAVSGESILLDTVFAGNVEAYNTGRDIVTISTAGMLSAASVSPGVCFVDGTAVLTDRGEVNIKDIAPGNMVWAWNTERLGRERGYWAWKGTTPSTASRGVIRASPWSISIKRYLSLPMPSSFI